MSNLLDFTDEDATSILAQAGYNERQQHNVRAVQYENILTLDPGTFSSSANNNYRPVQQPQSPPTNHQHISSHQLQQDEPSEKLNARNQSYYTTRKLTQSLKYILGIGLIILVFAISVYLIVTSLKGTPSRTSGKHHNNNDHTLKILDTSTNQHSSVQHIGSNKSQNISVFYFDFVSGTSIQDFQKHPPEMGIPDLDMTRLLDYRICCVSHSLKFICSSGTTFMNKGLALDGFLEADELTDDIYLYLWINNNDLVEVGCVLSGSMRDQPS